MSRVLSRFIHRNITGQQSLKPIVRSYYSDVSARGISGSDAISRDSVTSSQGNVEHEDRGFTPLGAQDSKGHTEATATRSYASPTSDTRVEEGNSLERTETTIDSEVMHEDSRGTQAFPFPQNRTLSTSDTPSVLNNANDDATRRNDFLTAAQTASVDGPNAPNETHDEQPRSVSSLVVNKDAQTFGNGLTTSAYVDKQATQDLNSPQRSIEDESMGFNSNTNASIRSRRRDFTQQVAAAILGNDSSLASVSSSRESASPLNNESVTPYQTPDATPEPLEVSVTINQVSIVSSHQAPTARTPSWQPPISLGDYLRERKEGKR
ncbi:hypothetical protein LRP49_04560 [Enterovibrio sp. ZSDZ35]|uniref:Uncharacterized protein n=1 Tax=Enterovibrio qingdaonensis TaxID=2899818 RepID=A0ABT5QHK5_9GAMM|nr:hypothetical protein [Enterovibrio sp. ZSDZ35]MDD1780467.1 hypothetical protein [Enterovibrio sp. ZSDZ35]